MIADTGDHGWTPLCKGRCFDLRLAGDLGFAESGAVKLPDLIGMECRCSWPTQVLAPPSQATGACATNGNSENSTRGFSVDAIPRE